MPLIRGALVRALGIGTGTAVGIGPAAQSSRGRIVRLSPTLAEEFGGFLAVIVSEPGYSNEMRFQNVVPIMSSVTYEPEGLDVPIQKATTSWLRNVDASLSDAFLSLRGCSQSSSRLRQTVTPPHVWTTGLCESSKTRFKFISSFDILRGYFAAEVTGRKSLAGRATNCGHRPGPVFQAPGVVLEGDFGHVPMQVARADGVVRPVQLALQPGEERFHRVGVRVAPDILHIEYFTAW